MYTVTPTTKNMAVMCSKQETNIVLFVKLSTVCFTGRKKERKKARKKARKKERKNKRTKVS